MKLVIKDSMVIASHSNNQNIKNLYSSDLEVIRIPDNVILKTSSKSPILNSNNSIFIDISLGTTDLPIDPRLDWDIEESRKNALSVIEDIAEEYRVEILTSMPGRIAGYEAKAKIASRIIEAENPDKSDIEALQLEADNKKITVFELAQLIIKRSEEFANISTYIDGEALRVKIAIEGAETTKIIWDSLKEFEQNILTKINN